MKPVQLGNFTGLNNKDHPLDVGFGGLVEATNVVLDNQGRISSRPGRTQVVAAVITAATAVGEVLYYLSAGNLYRFAGAGPAELLTALAGSALHGAELGNSVYLQTDVDQVVVLNSYVRPLGLNPPPPPILAVGVGNLAAGRYSVCVSELDVEGRESGTSQLTTVTLTAGSSLSITTGLSLARIYATAPDGEAVFWLADVSSTLLSDPAYSLGLKEVCVRMNKGRLPLGHMMIAHHSRLLVADHDLLWISDPFDPEVCDFTEGMIPFGAPITLLESVDAGVFIATDKDVFFLSGIDADGFSPQWVYNAAAIPGSAIRIPMSRLGATGAPGVGVLFATSRGLCVGTPDGSVTNLTERKHNMPAMASAVGSYTDGSYLLCYNSP